MRQYDSIPQTAEQISRYFTQSDLPTQQETLGRIVTEILISGKNLNRKAVCARLLVLLEHAADEEEERHYQKLIGLIFGRETQ